MEQIKKQNIVNHLQAYCERYESQKRAANSLKGVSAATVSQMLSGKWEQIADEMWRNVAAQIGYKDEKWEAVQTRDFRLLTRLLDEAKENTLVMGVTGDAGSGKTFALKHYTASHRQTYLLCCNEYWNRKTFLSELLAAMGRDYTGYTVGAMMAEADKLSDQVLYFFITLYNSLEDECGIVLCATQHLEKRIKKGIKLNKKGYAEIWSRLGRKCVALSGVSSADITAICEANGISDLTDIDDIIADSDLRRVKRRVHAVSRKRQLKTA